MNTLIQKSSEVSNGRACIRNTPVTVWGLVNSRRRGLKDAQILAFIAWLTPDDLRAAWDYYRDNTAEIDHDIRRNETA